jgi:uncharacterized protein (DUF2249 family)
VDVLLDVSSLEPPEPLERVLGALGELAEGDRLRVQLRRQPFPLYNFLRQMGYEWETTGAEERFEVLIWPTDLSGSSRQRRC